MHCKRWAIESVAQLYCYYLFLLTRQENKIRLGDVVWRICNAVVVSARNIRMHYSIDEPISQVQSEVFFS